MDVRNQLIEEKAKLLTEIAEAARQGESKKILALGEKLKTAEVLIERYERLLSDISDLATNGHGAQISQRILENSRLRINTEPEKANVESGRESGRIIRMSFLKNISGYGIRLRHIKGSIYETQSRYKVGIAVATERKLDRWFLGLPLNEFDHAVLLCQPDKGDTIEVCLPVNFFAEYGNMMSRSGGQMKFNIARRGSGYVILVPRTDGVSVSKYLGEYSTLQ